MMQGDKPQTAKTAVCATGSALPAGIAKVRRARFGCGGRVEPRKAVVNIRPRLAALRDAGQIVLRVVGVARAGGVAAGQAAGRGVGLPENVPSVPGFPQASSEPEMRPLCHRRVNAPAEAQQGCTHEP